MRMKWRDARARLVASGLCPYLDQWWSYLSCYGPVYSQPTYTDSWHLVCLYRSVWCITRAANSVIRTLWGAARGFTWTAFVRLIFWEYKETVVYSAAFQIGCGRSLNCWTVWYMSHAPSVTLTRRCSSFSTTPWQRLTVKGVHSCSPSPCDRELFVCAFVYCELYSNLWSCFSATTTFILFIGQLTIPQ